MPGPRTTTRNKKGSSVKSCPFSVPRGGAGPPISLTGLRQVIAERGEHHVVDGLGLDASRPGPAALGYVRVLETPTDSTLRALVHLMPEPQGTFLNDADVTRARAGPRRGSPRRR